MFGRCISRYSKSLTTNLQKSIQCSPSITRVSSLPHLKLLFTEQPGNKFYASTTPLSPCCHSTLISLRFFSTEGVVEPGDDAPSDLPGVELETIAVNSSTSKQNVEEERERNMNEQESRMNNIIIRGVSETSNDEELRKAVTDIFRSIGFNTDEAVIKRLFRFERGEVLCELSERKWVNIVFACNKKNWKNIDGSVWINQWLCPGFVDIDYRLRILKREGKIKNNGVYNGKPRAQLLESEESVEITHLHDLVELGLIHEV